MISSGTYKLPYVRIEENNKNGIIKIYDTWNEGKFNSSIFLENAILKVVDCCSIEIEGQAQQWKYNWSWSAGLHLYSPEEKEELLRIVKKEYREVVKPGKLGQLLGVAESMAIKEGWVELQETKPFYRRFVGKPIVVIFTKKESIKNVQTNS